ncbi:MAG: hypothetical protein KIT11_11550 [Fimbriimonadaceae bacterium]|nr:hypothetical protein [Fimbriimonadaceae bacterium]QYK55332.1 MAG: hypothetical protein KF733_09985 [Fimbriimonadaceae bacterium]
MRKVSLFGLALALLSLQACAPTAPPKADGGTGSTGRAAVDPNSPAYTLKISEEKGAKWSYTYMSRSKSEPTDEEWKKKLPKMYQDPATFEVTGEVEMEVVEVKDGKTTFKTKTVTKTAKGTGFGDAQAKDLLAKEPQLQKFTVKSNWENIDQQQVLDPLTNTMNKIFPSKPVRVGETWEFTPFKEMKPAVAKVMGLEPIAGEQTLKVFVKIPGIYPTSVDELTLWVNPKNSRIYKFEMINNMAEQGLKVESYFVQEIKK